MQTLYLCKKWILQKMLSIIKEIRSNNLRDQAISALYLNIQHLQVLALILSSYVDGFYLSLSDVLLIFNKKTSDYSTVIIINACFSALFLIILVLGLILNSFCMKNKKISKIVGAIISIISTITNMFRYIFFLPAMCLNLSVFDSQTTTSSSQFYLKIFAAINLAISIFISLVELYANWSNRFIQIDFCNRRQNSIISLMLYIGFVIYFKLFNQEIGIIILLFYGIWNIFQLIMVLEFATLQKTILTYNISALIISLILLIQPKSTQQVDSFHFYTGKFYILTFYFILCWFICSLVSKKIVQSLSYWYFNQILYLKPECQYQTIFGNIHAENQFKQNQQLDKTALIEKSLSADGAIQVQTKFMKSGDNQRTALNSIQLVSRIFLCHQVHNKILWDHQYNNWDFWWQKFNLALLSHLISCDYSKCKCKKQKKNKQILRFAQAKWLLRDLQRLIGKIQAFSNNDFKLKITKIHLHVQLDKKPLRGYYQIMRMKKGNISAFDHIDIETLIVQTRECFDQIFLKNNVKNSELPLLMVFEVEELSQAIQNKIRDGIDLTIKFLQIFLQNSLKLAQIRKSSNQLIKLKGQVGDLFEKMVLKYPEVQEVSALFIVFYEYLEIYKSRIKEFKSVYHEKSMNRRILQKNEVNVLSPEYGVIYLDLAGGEKGKIKNVNKIVCKLYENTKQDMISYNIREFMPKIFSIYHDRFLTNFVQKGKIKILKNKQRILFGRNKQKFIFPFLARLKTEHLFNDQFGASALVSVYQTNSNYFIASKKGTLSEATVQIYNDIFYPSLKQEVEKINRFNIYKMIPELLRIVRENEHEIWPGKIHQSLFIYSTYPEIFLDKFLNKRFSDNQNSRSQASAASGSSYKQKDSQIQSKFDFNNEFMVGLFKNFLSEVPLMKLSAQRIQYKVSTMKTEQFELVLLEILGRTVVQNPILPILEEYRPLIQKMATTEDLQKIDKNFEAAQNDSKILDNNTLSVDRRVKKIQRMSLDNPIKIQQNIQLIEERTLNDFDKISENNNLDPGHLNSERSSITDQTQGQLRKQTLITGFNSKNKKIQNSLIIFFVILMILMIGVLVTFLITTVANLKKISEYGKQFQFYLLISETFEYKLAARYINQFLENGQNQPSLQVLTTNINEQLSQSFKMQVKGIPLITQSQFIEETFLLKPVTIYDNIMNTMKNITLLELFNEIQYIFHTENSRNTRFLRINYQAIHNILNAVILEESQIIRAYQKQIEISSLAIFICYEILILFISISFILIAKHFQRRESKILSLLIFNSAKQIYRARQKLAQISEIIKKKKISESINEISAFQYSFNIKNIEVTQQKYLRHPKLIFDAASQNQKLNQFICIISCVIFIVFSGLAVFLLVMQYSNFSVIKLHQNVRQQYHGIEIKAALLINIYLSTANQIYQNEPIVLYSEQIHNQVQSDYFKLTNFLSMEHQFMNSISEQVQGSQSNAQLMDSRPLYNIKLCQFDSNLCNPLQKYSQMLLQYHILQLRNKINFFGPQKLKLREGTPNQITKWSNQNQIVKLLPWVYHIYYYSRYQNTKLDQTIEAQITKNINIIIVVSIVTIPIYAIILCLMIYKYIRSLFEIIQRAEGIFIHLPFHVLIENTYLHSYFNEKIKNGD